MSKKFILASGSAARQEMLRSAGYKFEICPADIDEKSITQSLTEEGKNHQDIAMTLATEKAKSVSENYPDQFIIGSDQLLVFNNKIMFKSSSQKEASEKLSEMKGKSHTLISSAVVVKNQKTLWQATDEANLEIKNFSDEFLDWYMHAAGEEITKSVGGYAIEGLGIRLFRKVQGDYFTIMGMPLLPLSNYLDQEIGVNYD